MSGHAREPKERDERMTPQQRRALIDLTNALLEWPCDKFEIRHDDGRVSRVAGGRHYAVDYTVARSRRSATAIENAVKAFPDILNFEDADDPA